VAFPLLCAAPPGPGSLCRFGTRCWQGGSQDSAMWSPCPGMSHRLSHLRAVPPGGGRDAPERRMLLLAGGLGTSPSSTAPALKSLLVPVASELSPPNTSQARGHTTQFLGLLAGQDPLHFHLGASLCSYTGQLLNHHQTTMPQPRPESFVTHSHQTERQGDTAVGQPHSAWATRCLNLPLAGKTGPDRPLLSSAHISASHRREITERQPVHYSQRPPALPLRIQILPSCISMEKIKTCL